MEDAKPRDKKVGRGVSLKESTWKSLSKLSEVMDRPIPWIFETAIEEFRQKEVQKIAERYYATPEGREELADWRAIQGEPFHDDLGDYQE